jgi:hypothetical protein
VERLVVDALDENLLFANATNEGLSLEDITRYQNYAFIYRDKDN